MRKYINMLVLMVLIIFTIPGGISYARVVPDIPDRYSRYVVKRGDTLWEISQKYLTGVNPVIGVKWIRKANKIPGYVIQPGDLIIVPHYDGASTLTYRYEGKSESRYDDKHNSEPVSRTEEWVATAYCSCSKCCGNSKGITASGTRARPGTLAVDPRLIPLGTRVYIDGMGWYRAEDTGGVIKGKIVDIWFPDHNEALKFGRKKVRVSIAY